MTVHSAFDTRRKKIEELPAGGALLEYPLRIRQEAGKSFLSTSPANDSVFDAIAAFHHETDGRASMNSR